MAVNNANNEGNAAPVIVGNQGGQPQGGGEGPPGVLQNEGENQQQQLANNVAEGGPPNGEHGKIKYQ